MGINSQKEKEKLEEATKEIYKAGFHTGIMRDTCGKYKGKKVAEAKELVKQDLLESGSADEMYDLSEEVVCRCGKKVIIKRIDDQWFIKYSDNELTEKSKEHAQSMNITPNEYFKNMPSVLDWFMDRACARLGNWLGTQLPFDERWTIEPISDSTLYPAYYIVSKYVNEKKLKPDQLTEEFFDYVYLGKGTASNVAKKIGSEKGLIEQVRKDFTYWYPLDINLGGKEHQTVHFPVFLMNHVALLDKKYWPKGIFVNYWVIGKGSKISKSKGGAEPIPGAIERYSVDGMRLYYAHVGSPHSDIVWDEEVVMKYKNAVDRVFVISDELLVLKGGKKSIDGWLVSRLNEKVKLITRSMEKFDLRESTTLIYFGVYDDLRWYMRRGGQNKKIIKKALSIWAKLLTPVTPHTAEELWNKLGHKNFVSSEEWPSFEESKIDLSLESVEDMISKTSSDIRSVMKLAKIVKPKNITLVVSSDWKYDFFRELKKKFAVTRNVGELIKELMTDENLKKNAKDVTKIIQSCVKDPSKLPFVVTSQEIEFNSLKESIDFFKNEYSCDINIAKAEESKESKAKSASPGKPAIILK